MCENQAMSVVEKRVLRCGDHDLIEIVGEEVRLVAVRISLQEQAAICAFLLSRLSDRLGIAPFAVESVWVEAVIDALGSTADFPGLNKV